MTDKDAGDLVISVEVDDAVIAERIVRLLESPEIPLAQRVRMAASIGALTGIVGAGGAFGEVPPAELAALVRAAVADLLAP